MSDVSLSACPTYRAHCAQPRVEFVAASSKKKDDADASNFYKWNTQPAPGSDLVLDATSVNLFKGF